MPEIHLVVVGAQTGAEEFNLARKRHRFEIGELGDFAAGEVDAVEVGAVVAIRRENQLLVV